MIMPSLPLWNYYIFSLGLFSATFMGTWASVISDMVEPQLISVAVSYGCMGIGLAHLIVVGNSGKNNKK